MSSSGQPTSSSYRTPHEPPGRPAPESDASAIREEDRVRRAVEDAGDAVLDRPEDWTWHALKPEEAEQTMRDLVATVIGDRPVPEGGKGESGGVAALALRLSDLLRQELLADPRSLADDTLLELVRRIEEVRIRLDPRATKDLTYLLTGANALELVVEFAHDLRSPLTSIMFLAETLRKGQSGEINNVQRDQLGIMYSAALGMVGMANDIMDLAGSEVHEDWGESAEETFSIQEIVEQARDTVAPMAEQKRLHIAFYTPAHDTRRGKPVLLGRVLLNLMTNAIKFTDQGRVEVVAEELPGDRVLFSVRDTGRGMSPDALESLDTLFGRSPSRTGYHFSGTGLGLTMCRRMIEMMGGELQVESELAEGTRFYFELELPKA